MRIFVVSLNDNIVASAGTTGEQGILSTTVTWVGSPTGDSGEGQLYFHLGGVDGATGDHLVWTTPVVNVGDEIKIKIIDSTHEQVSQNFIRKQMSESDS